MPSKPRSLTKGTQIVYDMEDDNPLTKGKVYAILEDETVWHRDWRIIRVTCDDGKARTVPPQFFVSADGKLLGCRDCFDRGIIHGGEDQGAFIKQCHCPSLTVENIYSG